jgi:hypothetical protein
LAAFSPFISINGNCYVLTLSMINRSSTGSSLYLRISISRKEPKSSMLTECEGEGAKGEREGGTTARFVIVVVAGED